MDSDLRKKREEMVGVIRKRYALNAPEVLDVMMRVPREKFAPKGLRDVSYDDAPVDIGYGQTMSQPYTVAKMSSLILENSKLKSQKSKPRNRVLEIGTGSGYQAAILSYFFDEVYTVEIVSELSHFAKLNLSDMGYENVFIKTGSGELGWKEKSPFDAVIITAGVEKVPEELFRQLKTKGVLVAPVGKGREKTMIRYTKQSGFNSKYKKEEFGTFHFVPFVKGKKHKA